MSGRKSGGKGQAVPEHLDFIRRALTWHNLTCEATLLADNVARFLGATVPDSIALSYTLMERIQCMQ